MKLNASNINTQTVSITDYKMISNRVARVILAFTGNHNSETITAALAQKFKHAAAPVENSFRMIRDGVAIGYVRANKEVRTVEPQELRASYKKVVASSNSNIMMDNNDQTLWELKTGAGGNYLTRHGDEDLSELVEASVHRRTDVPRLNQIARASVAKREFVAFASSSGDMDYGFCVAVDDAAGKVRVVSAAMLAPMDIPHEAIASVLPVGSVKIPRATHERILASGIDRKSANDEIAYYTRLFSYDRAYLDEVIDAVESTAAA